MSAAPVEVSVGESMIINPHAEKPTVMPYAHHSKSSTTSNNNTTALLLPRAPSGRLV
jgi:hypothetical protein